MSKRDVKNRLRNGFPVSTKRFLGRDMHSSKGGDRFKYLNCDETAIKDDAVYKVWCYGDSPREAFDSWSYLVFYFEEVPKIILEIEARVDYLRKCLDDYWNSLSF
jgi:hypothetical protein